MNLQLDNATVVSTAYSTGIFDGTAEFRIGNTVSGIGAFDGRIASLGIWKNRILTQQERNWFFTANRGIRVQDLSMGLTTNLESWWGFEGHFYDAMGRNFPTNNNGVSFAAGKI